MLHNDQYQTFIFDFDDTLIDTTTIIKYALNIIYHDHFKNHSSPDFFEQQFHIINEQVWRQVSENKISARDARIERINQLSKTLKIDSVDCIKIAMQFTDLISADAVWLPGVKEVFFELCKKNTVIIITNGMGEVQRKRAELLGMLNHCSEFICAGDDDFAKPDPRIFESALKKTNSCKSKTLVIGDSIECDLVGALNSGLDFCWINPKKNILPPNYPKPKYELPSVKDLISEALVV